MQIYFINKSSDTTHPSLAVPGVLLYSNLFYIVVISRDNRAIRPGRQASVRRL